MVGSIRGYEGSYGNADSELAALGTRIGERFFNWAQQIVARRIDHWKLQTFTEHGGVPVYNAAFSNVVIVAAVEDDPDDGITLTVMLALRQQPTTILGQHWDGRDLSFLRDAILAPRLEDYLA